MAWFGRGLRDHPVPTPCSGLVAPHQTRLPWAHPNWLWVPPGLRHHSSSAHLFVGFSQFLYCTHLIDQYMKHLSKYEEGLRFGFLFLHSVGSILWGKKKWKTKSNNKIFVLWCFVITVLWWENAAVITWSLWLIYWRVAAVGVGSWPYILLLRCVPSYGCTAISVRELLWKELKTIKKKRGGFKGTYFRAQLFVPSHSGQRQHKTESRSMWQGMGDKLSQKAAYSSFFQQWQHLKCNLICAFWFWQHNSTWGPPFAKCRNMYRALCYQEL